MNPPILAGFTGYFYTLLTGGKFTLDSHTGAFDDPKWTWLKPLHIYLAKRAACNTVTNGKLAAKIEKWGGTAIILSDIPYELPQREYPVKSDAFNVCFVCTFGLDEPVADVLKAVEDLPNVHLYVTGKPEKAPKDLVKSAPPNVTFTGFLSNEDYAGLLHSVDAVLVLTTRDLTMQRGGSEAVTVGKPLITSDWPVLREIFWAGAVHCNNTFAGIRDAIEDVMTNREKYLVGIRILRAAREKQWEATRVLIESFLEPKGEMEQHF